jgi:small subunit ribosomal protein S1
VFVGYKILRETNKMWCYVEASFPTHNHHNANNNNNIHCIHKRGVACKYVNKLVAIGFTRSNRCLNWSNDTKARITTTTAVPCGKESSRPGSFSSVWLGRTRPGGSLFSTNKRLWKRATGYKNDTHSPHEEEEDCTTTSAVVLVRAEETENEADDSSKKLLEDMWSKITQWNGTSMHSQVLVSKQDSRPRLVANKRKVMGKVPVPTCDISFSYGDLDREVGDIHYTFTAGDIRKGVIVEIINDGALVDIGAKSTALLPSHEVSLYPVESIHDVLQVGDEKEFVLLDADSDSGHVKVSIRRLELERAWQKLNAALEEASTLEAQVVATNRGGCLVLVHGIRGFLPTSHISLPGTTLEEMVGHVYPVKCLEVDKSKGRLVVSHRRAMAERQMENLKTGALVEGTVQGVKPYGVFVDVFGTSGLLHISQISHDQVTNIQSLFSTGEKVKCMVVSFDKQRGRISLSTKALEPHPGDMLRNKQLVYEKAEEMAMEYNERMESPPVRSKNISTGSSSSHTSSSTDDIIAGLDIGSLDDLDPILFGSNSMNNASSNHHHPSSSSESSSHGTTSSSSTKNLFSE